MCGTRRWRFRRSPTRRDPNPHRRSRDREHLDVVDRARRYLSRVEPAIAGQHGDVHTFRVCCRIARGFALDAQDAFRVLSEWNARCVPPWSERELNLVAKIAHARRYGREPLGHLHGGASHGTAGRLGA